MCLNCALRQRFVFMLNFYISMLLRHADTVFLLLACYVMLNVQMISSAILYFLILYYVY